MLRKRKITLVSPNTWEDQNDSHHLNEWGKRNNKVPLALCLAESSETFHHWKVFASGASGVCIVFNGEKLSEWARAIPGMHFRQVEYKKMTSIWSDPPNPDQMPFLKRWGYQDEREHRLAYLADKGSPPFVEFDFDISMIRGIVLSPWIYPTISKEMKTLIQGTRGCSKLRVNRTTLRDNPSWKNLSEPK